jgi:hypothetical protein
MEIKTKKEGHNPKLNQGGGVPHNVWGSGGGSQPPLSIWVP